MLKAMPARINKTRLDRLTAEMQAAEAKMAATPQYHAKADTKDIDDAISIERLDNGNLLLGVHIADVAYYVKPGSALFKDAESRKTSVYIGDLVVPMLPPKLSNGICSLNPNVERLARSTFMEYNPKGKMVDYYTCCSVIKSRKKMTYEDLNNYFDGIIDELTLVNKKLQKRNISLSKTKKEQYSSFLKLKKYSDDLEKRNTALSITKKELFDKMIKLNSNINSLKNMVSYYDNEIVSLSEKLDNQTKNYEELNEMFAKTVTKKYLLEDENNYLRKIKWYVVLGFEGKKYLESLGYNCSKISQVSECTE